MTCMECGAAIVASRPGNDPLETIETCANGHEMAIHAFRAAPRPIQEMNDDELSGLLDMFTNIAAEGVLWHTNEAGERELIDLDPSDHEAE